MLYADPEASWVRSLLETFYVAPGDPYDNSARFLQLYELDDEQLADYEDAELYSWDDTGGNS